MSQLRSDFLRSIEAGCIGLLLVQAIRFGYATLYARTSSADLIRRVPDPSAFNGIPGVIDLATVKTEGLILGVLLLLPILALIISRWRMSFPFAVLLVALGRSMALQTDELIIPSTALVIGAGLLYLTLTIIRRPTFFPVMLLLGFTGDQLIRALGNTYDHSWQAAYRLPLIEGYTIEMGLLISLVAIALILFSIFVWYTERRAAAVERDQAGYAPPLNGHLNLWGGLALGGMFYLEFTLLGLPNAVARWSGTNYTGLVPWLLAATTLPLIPEVRNLARRFVGMFDSVWRGWLWALALGLLLVVGRRYAGLLAGSVLITAQFLVCLSLWWPVQTGISRRNPTGLTILLAVISFAALAVGDYFTYDYAYVRDLAAPYQSLSDLLRSLRDMGLGLALVAALLVSLPMILARRRIPWYGARAAYTFLGLLLVLGVSFAGATIAPDNFVRRPANPDCLRAATFNIHGGYSQFFDPNLERVAQLIELNGVDLVLLQEVDTGRLASFGIDQVLWLARRLDMEAAFYPQNEALQGLAVLSRVPIIDQEGLSLPSTGNQAVAMHITLDPENLTADPLAADLGYLHLYNAWLGFRVAERDGQPIPEGEQDQNQQLNLLLNWIKNGHGPSWTDRILLGGTFNFGPDSPLYLALTNPVIKDPFAGLRTENTKTVFLVDGTAARYDYLWTFNLPLNSAGIDHSPESANTSDHHPAIVAISRHQGITCPP